MFKSPLTIYNLLNRSKCPRFDNLVCHRYLSLKKCFFFTVKSTETSRGGQSTLEHLRPEVVLSEENRKSFVKRFKTTNASRTKEGSSQAAVLIPLCMNKGELGFLYTLRSTKVSVNRGQVSFPGGMYDKEDKSLRDTALRETWEELKIPREKVDVWTSGGMIDKRNVTVLPVFGYTGEIEPEKLDVNKDEVEEAFFFSLKRLCDPTLFRYTQFRDGYTLPAYIGGKHRVWGFTAAITHMALNALVPNAYNQKLVHLRSSLSKQKTKDAPPS